MNCGCTIQRPGCAEGEALFAALAQAARNLNTQSREQRADRQSAYYNAERAYLDHLADRREGDLKVRKEAERWLIEMRWQRQWTFQLSTSEGESLRLWLKEHSFWRYAQIDGGQAWDHLTGYYHKRAVPSARQQQDHPVIPGASGPQRSGEWPFEQMNTLGGGMALSPGSEIDLKTQVTMMIALLVIRVPRPLTLVDRLTIQKRAVSWLVSHGVQQIGTSDRRTVEALIEEAIRLRRVLESQAGRDS